MLKELLLPNAPVLGRDSSCFCKAALPLKVCRSWLSCLSRLRGQDKGLVTPGDHAYLQSISGERHILERWFFSSPGSGEDCRDYLGAKKLSLLSGPRRETVTLSTTWHACFSEAEEACGVSIININDFLGGGDKT